MCTRARKNKQKPTNRASWEEKRQGSAKRLNRRENTRPGSLNHLASSKGKQSNKKTKKNKKGKFCKIEN